MKKLLVIGIGIAVLTGACVGLAMASTLEIVEKDQIPVAVDQGAPGVETSADLVQATTNAAEKTAPVSTADISMKPAAPASSGLLQAASEGVDAVKRSDKKTMPAPKPVPVTMGEPTRYTLGPDDVIEIVVRRHPEFSGNYPVNAEGKIQYKFVGDIEIKGLTKNELKDKIAQILGKYIISPDVEVTILEYRSKVIYVIGEVGGPGKYYMKADKISLREAVVQAGLPTLAAAMRRTILIRPDKSGKPKQLKVDLYALLYEGKLNLDQDMFPGDVLFVPATLFAKIGRIINPVAQPILQSDTLRRAGTGGI